MYKNIITKEFLEQEYITNKRNMENIANQINCSRRTISSWLKKYNIKIRSLSESHKGEHASNYIDGRCSEKHYCIDCKTNEISYPTWRYGKRRCGSCCKKGNKNNKFIDGRKTTTHFCIEQGCNNEISYNNWRIGNKRCIKCSNQGEYNANWQNGISKLPYAFDFTPELRESIRKRDEYACQNCGMTEEEHLIVRGTVLDIHHIDYDKMNSKEDNLITTCNSCNTRANFNRDYWKSFYQSKILEILNKKE